MGVVGRGSRSVHVFDILKTISQVADEGVVHVFEHSALPNDIADALGSYDCDCERHVSRRRFCLHDVGAAGTEDWEGYKGMTVKARCSTTPDDIPSSLRIYLRAKARLVSLRSTMRTFPKAPRPTTRRRRK